MGFVVGKKVAPPEGTTVVFECTGPLAQMFALAVRNGRAIEVEPPDEPTVQLAMSTPVFVHLSTGRGDAKVIAREHVQVAGDAQFGAQVIEAMNVLF